MAFNVNDFTSDMSSLGGGLARANMFRVSITNPTGLGDSRNAGSSSAGGSTDLLIKGAQIPGSTLAPLPVQYGGRSIKLTGFRTFDNWTVTIINDEEYAHRLWIQNWMYSIAGMPDGTRGGIEKSSLYNMKTDATVTTYNNQATAVSTWNIKNMWPTALGDITLDWSSDTIEEYTCEFAFEYWTHGHKTAGSDGVITEVTVVSTGAVA